MPSIRYKQSTSDKGVASNGVTAATIFTFGASLLDPDDAAAGHGGIVDAIDLYNADTVQHLINLHLIASGGSLGSDTMIPPAPFTLPAGQSVRIRGPFRAKDSATLQIKLGEAHTTNPVYAKVEVSELH